MPPLSDANHSRGRYLTALLVTALVFSSLMASSALAANVHMSGKGLNFIVARQGNRATDVMKFDVTVPATCRQGPLGKNEITVHMKFDRNFSVVPSTGAFSGAETVSSEHGSILGQAFDFTGKFTYTGKVKGTIAEDGKTAKGFFWLHGTGEQEIAETESLKASCSTGWFPWKASV
jgi:hypothetical protein